MLLVIAFLVLAVVAGAFFFLSKKAVGASPVATDDKKTAKPKTTSELCEDIVREIVDLEKNSAHWEKVVQGDVTIFKKSAAKEVPILVTQVDCLSFHSLSPHFFETVLKRFEPRNACYFGEIG